MKASLENKEVMKAIRDIIQDQSESNLKIIASYRGMCYVPYQIRREPLDHAAQKSEHIKGLLDASRGGL